MRTLVLATALALTMVQPAGATDVQNQDPVAHTVTVDGKTKVEIPADTEINDVCNGCNVALADGTSVDAQADSIVVIVDGMISIAE